MAYDREYVLSLLKSGACHLQYKKLDGTMRWADGTLKGSLIPMARRAEGTSYEGTFMSRAADLVTYYDITAGGWRSFRTTFLNKIERVVEDMQPVRSQVEEEDDGTGIAVAASVISSILSTDDTPTPEPVVGGGGEFDGGGASASWESPSSDDSSSSSSSDSSSSDE